MDTIRMAERLAKGGVFTEDQAKRIATAFADCLQDEFATKQDLALSRRDLEVLWTELKPDPRRDWYIWRDPARGGGPPTNWLSHFGGSGWESLTTARICSGRICRSISS